MQLKATHTTDTAHATLATPIIWQRVPNIHVSMTSLGLPVLINIFCRKCQWHQYLLPKMSVTSIFAAQNVSDINICCPKCQWHQYLLPKMLVTPLFAAQNVRDINICCPKCQRHQYLLPKMSVTFPLSILSGNRLPLCLPRSWQAAQLFCSASLIFCPATFAFGFLSFFWNCILVFCATQSHLFWHWRHFVIRLSMAQWSRLKRLQRLKVSLKQAFLLPTG